MFILILLLSTWSVVHSDPLNFLNDFHKFPPPYLKSNDEFTKAARYLHRQLPYQNISESNLEFGLIVKIISELAYAIRPQNPPKKYKPYKILDAHLKQAWKEYKLIVNKTEELLLDAENKIKPITGMLHSNCKGIKNSEVCNKILAKIIKSKAYLQPHANLLLQLGRVSINFNAFSHTFDVLSVDRQQIPFLRHHLDDSHIRHFIKELNKTYSLIKHI